MVTQLVTFTKQADGILRIAIAGDTAKEKRRNKKEIAEMVADHPSWGIDRQFLELCEYELCNGWECILPEECGALTDALIFSDEVTWGGEFGDTITHLGTVYWNPNYAIMNEVEELLRVGYVDFAGVK